MSQLQTRHIAPTPDEGFVDGEDVPVSVADSLGDCWGGAAYDTGVYVTSFPLHLIGKWRIQPTDAGWGEVHPHGECIDEYGYCGNGEGCLINSYVEAMQRGDAFPSIEIVYRPKAADEKTWLDEGAHTYAPWLVEGGYHRNSAWRTAGYTHAPAIVYADSAAELEEAKVLLGLA